MADRKNTLIARIKAHFSAAFIGGTYDGGEAMTLESIYKTLDAFEKSPEGTAANKGED